MPRMNDFFLILMAQLFLARLTYSVGTIKPLLKKTTDTKLYFNQDIDYMNAQSNVLGYKIPPQYFSDC